MIGTRKRNNKKNSKKFSPLDSKKSVRLQLESLEDRITPSTINFIQTVGTAANFSNVNTTKFTTLEVPINSGHDVSAGRSIFVELAADPRNISDPSQVTVTDTANNTYTLDASVAHGKTTVYTFLFSAHGVNPLEFSDGDKITISFPEGEAQAVTVVEVSGIDAADPYGGLQSTNSGNSNLDPTSGPVSKTTDYQEFLVGAFGVEGNIDEADPNNGFIPGVGWSAIDGNGTPSGNSGNKNVSIHAEFRLVDGVSPGQAVVYEADGLFNDNADGKWAVGLHSYKADAAVKFLVEAPPSVGGGDIFEFTVTALDANDNVVPGYTGTVTFASSDPSAVLPGSYTFTFGPDTADDNGVHTFPAQLFTAGFQTITVTDALGGVSGTSNVIEVKAPSIDFVDQPQDGIAGAILDPITVQMYDVNDDPVPGPAGSTITVSIFSGPTNDFLGTKTVAVNGAGLATFSDFAFEKAGTYTLRATSSDPSFGSALSTSFTISAASASQLVFTQQPTNTTAGNTISPAVQVSILDQFDNVVNTNATVALSPTGPGAFSGGSTTSVNAVNGVATFSNLTLQTAGQYFLTASSNALSADSDTFIVSAAAASELAFLQQPTNTTAGNAINPAVSVQVLDSFGNVVNTNANISLAPNGPGNFTTGSTSTVSAVNGIATFSNLVLQTAGSYTLTASTSGLSNVNSNSFVVSAAAANQLVFVQQPTNTTAGVAISPAVTVSIVDQFNNVVNTTANVSVVANGPAGFTGGSTTTVAAVNGLATFSSLTLNTAGTYTMTVSSAGLTNTTSNSFVVSAASASQLVFTQQPTNTTAGNVISPAVQVSILDQFDNVVNTNAAVALSPTGPGAFSGGSTTSVNAVNGVATFSNLTLQTAGQYFLTASSNALSADSDTFIVSAAVASELAFVQQPTNTTAGNAISPAVSVQVLDSFGNVVNTNANISLAPNGPGNFTAGSTSTVSAVNGIATFSNLVLQTAGSYTLTASTSGLSNVNSNSFVVSAAAANQLVFVQQPTNTTAGVAISPAVTVSIVDQFGNQTSGNNSITISANGPGPFTGSSTTTVSAVNGLATFSNLVLNTTGQYTLTATSSFDSATSDSFVVSAASASQLVFSQQPTNTTAGVAISPAVQVSILDQFDNLVNTNAIVALSPTGPGAFTGGSTTSVNAVNGIATFSNLKLQTAGQYFLTASSNALSADSDSFIVSAAAASELAFVQQPTNTTAGNAISPAVSVQVLDSFGNVVNTSANISLAPNGPGNFTAGSTSTVSAVNGIATFSNLVLQTAGSYTLTASTSGLSNVNSNSFVVSAAAANQLVFVQQPTNTTAGVAISPAVTLSIVDQFNNVVNTTANVSVVANGPAGFAGGSTTTVAAFNGLATFSNLILNTAGTYTISATSSGLANATSNSFVVSAGLGTTLAFSQQPSDTIAGQAINPAVIVQVLDNFGNIANSNASITLTPNGPAGFAGGTTNPVNAVNGVAIFSNLILQKVGTYTLTAASSGFANVTSNSFDISAAAVNTFTVEGYPSPITAGDLGSFSVTAKDAFDNIVTGYVGTVSFTSSDNAAILPANYTFVGGDQGTKSFDATLNTVGIQSITATDVANSSVTGSQTDIIVETPAPIFRPIDGVDDQNRGVICNPITFQLLAPDDAPGPFTIQIDWEGDGVYDFTISNWPQQELIISHTYESLGTFNAIARVTDETTNEVVDLPVDPPITIWNALVIDGDLVVGGGNGNDAIVVDASNPADVYVKLNNVTLSNPAGGAFSMSTESRIIVNGCGGNDNIQVRGSMPSELNGGDGNDSLYGGAADDVLRGGNGRDYLSGANGNDVLIGGLDRDLLYGGGGDDILIGGETERSYDDLMADLAAWISTNNAAALASLFATVSDPDGLSDYDRLSGGTGRDAFIYRATGSRADYLSDFSSSDGDEKLTF